MKITVDEIKGENIEEAIMFLYNEVIKETELGEKIRYLAQKNHIAIGRLIEAICTSVLCTNEDFETK